MTADGSTFYEDMAGSYDLLFDDWQRAIDRQRTVISRLIGPPSSVGPILDCACGIGTQALGLASLGLAIEGSDLSAAAIERAKAEAASRHLSIEFRVDDMRTLATSPPARFGAVLAFDNALPHLDSDEEVLAALQAMQSRLRPAGRLLISLRDYGPLMQARPQMMPPCFFGEEGRRRIVHQIWEWQDERRYQVHIFITSQAPNEGWVSQHFTGCYRAISPQEVAECMRRVGLDEVRVLSERETGYYQPIVSAVRPRSL
jgi:glycine/sarcosine N-methyltransferase